MYDLTGCKALTGMRKSVLPEMQSHQTIDPDYMEIKRLDIASWVRV